MKGTLWNTQKAEDGFGPTTGDFQFWISLTRRVGEVGRVRREQKQKVRRGISLGRPPFSMRQDTLGWFLIAWEDG